MGNNKNNWQLLESEVSWTGMGSTSSKSKKPSIELNEFDLPVHVITLIHLPSSIEVSAEVSEAFYSKKEMKKQKDVVFAQLWQELEKKVGRYFKVPGM